MKKSSVVLALLLLGVSCSKENSSSSRILEKSTQDVSDNTSISLLQSRSKSSEDTRQSKLDVLSNKERNLGDKLRAAEVYFKNFEFQLLTDRELTDVETRNAYYLEAANEFTTWVGGLYENIKPKKMSTLNKGKTSDETFYALAANLHRTNIYQDKLSKMRGMKAVSFLDLIEGALKKDHQHENLMEYEEVLVSGRNKEIMVELLKARMDFMGSLALKNLTDSRSISITQKSRNAIFKITGGALFEVDMPEVYDITNEATKNQTERYLDSSIKTKILLRSVDVNKHLEKNLKSAFEMIDFNESKLTPEEKREVDERKDKLRYLITVLIDVTETGSASYTFIP